MPEVLPETSPGLESEEYHEKLAFADDDLIGAFAQSVKFGQCRSRAARLAGAVLHKVRFTDCDLPGAQFSGANIRGARFQRCELAGVGGITSWAGRTCIRII